MSEHATNNEFVAHGADPLLAELLPLAGALAHAAATDNSTLYRAREADCRELTDPLCRHKLHSLVIVMAVELDQLGWRPDLPAVGAGTGEPPVLEWKDDRS